MPAIRVERFELSPLGQEPGGPKLWRVRAELSQQPSPAWWQAFESPVLRREFRTHPPGVLYNRSTDYRAIVFDADDESLEDRKAFLEQKIVRRVNAMAAQRERPSTGPGRGRRPGL